MSRMNQYLYSLIHGIGTHVLLILSSRSKWSLSIIWMEEAKLVKQQARVGKMLLTNFVSEEERTWVMSEWITD